MPRYPLLFLAFIRMFISIFQIPVPTSFKQHIQSLSIFFIYFILSFFILMRNGIFKFLQSSFLYFLFNCILDRLLFKFPLSDHIPHVCCRFFLLFIQFYLLVKLFEDVIIQFLKFAFIIFHLALTI